MRSQSSLLVSYLVLLSLAACGSPEPPVGTIAVVPDQLSLAHSGWGRVELRWRMNAALTGLEGEPRVLLHLIDGSGGVQRTFDHPLPGGWKAGEERVYEVEVFQSALSPPLELGDYQLTVGLYDAAGHRWPLTTEAPEVAAAEYALGTVRAVEPSEGFPELYFSAAWLPIEKGTDLQILGRRWLAGDGALRVGQIGRDGSLWLRVGIPTGTDRQEMVLSEGAVQPTASISTDCSAFQAELAGSGSHTLEIPIPLDGEAPGDCEVRFSANFELISKENTEKRTVALENLAWMGP